MKRNTKRILWGGIIIIGLISLWRISYLKKEIVGSKTNTEIEVVQDGKRNSESKCKVWLADLPKNIESNCEFEIKLYADTCGKKLGVFNVTLNFDREGILINKDKGENGFDKGRDTGKYMILANADKIDSGEYRFAGITASDYAQGNKVELIIIHARTTNKFKPGKYKLKIKVNEFGDELGKVLPVKVMGDYGNSK